MELKSYNIVNRHNIQTLSFAIKHTIQQSSFIALDIEFTGLGDVKKTRSPNIEDRYIALTNLAQEYAVIAVGLSTFKKSENGYIVNNFHFVMLSLDEHKLSPSSISFLIEHGFDFNDQYRNGIPYKPGNDSDIQSSTIFRNIIEDVLMTKCPVVLHNGLLDLVFLYQSFYAQLPTSLAVFIADISEMFQGGIYDTNERIQEDRKSQGLPCIETEIREPIPHKAVPVSLKLHELGLAPKPNRPALNTGKPFCEQYAYHGFCHDGQKCPKSHDLDLILDHELPKSKKPRIEKIPKEEDHISKPSEFNQTHSAAFDAYMTGYIFAHQQLVEEDIVKEGRNRIYLIGKQIPLIIEKSHYTKPSKQHTKKRLT